MPENLPDWPRKYFDRHGGKPFLFYVIYGEFGPLPALSSSKYRSNGVPAGFDLLHYDSNQYSDVLNGFREGYLWDQLQSKNSELASKIGESREMQALGAVIEEGQEIKMNSLPKGMSCHHTGDLDNPDFNNVHIEIV